MGFGRNARKCRGEGRQLTQPCADIKTFETRQKALRHKGLLLFLTPSALSATVSEYHAAANGRDTSDSGRCWSDLWLALDGENAPFPDLRAGSWALCVTRDLISAAGWRIGA
jgi:hypothetical protein